MSNPSASWRHRPCPAVCCRPASQPAATRRRRQTVSLALTPPLPAVASLTAADAPGVPAMRPASGSNTNLQAMQAQGGGAALTPALLAQHQAAMAAATATSTAGSAVRPGQQQMAFNLQMQQQMQLMMLQQAQQQQAAAAAAGRAPSPAGAAGGAQQQLVGTAEKQCRSNGMPAQPQTASAGLQAARGGDIVH